MVNTTLNETGCADGGKSRSNDLLSADSAVYKDGEPCRHRGCLNHVSHPCEGCGRIAGRDHADSAALTISNDDLRFFIAKIHKYISDENPEQYSAETIIKDVNYLLGLSIDPKFGFANGFDEFKKYVESALSR